MLPKIWQLKLDWDTQLPPKYCEHWVKFRNEIIELHGFCDASEKAYGAVVYIRSKDEIGEIFTNILCSKSKLSPLSKKSIAKLELCGAKMLRCTTQWTEHFIANCCQEQQGQRAVWICTVCNMSTVKDGVMRRCSGLVKYKAT